MPNITPVNSYAPYQENPWSPSGPVNTGQSHNYYSGYGNSAPTNVNYPQNPTFNAGLPSQGYAGWQDTGNLSYGPSSGIGYYQPTATGASNPNIIPPPQATPPPPPPSGTPATGGGYTLNQAPTSGLPMRNPPPAQPPAWRPPTSSYNPGRNYNMPGTIGNQQLYNSTPSYAPPPWTNTLPNQSQPDVPSGSYNPAGTTSGLDPTMLQGRKLPVRRTLYNMQSNSQELPLMQGIMSAAGLDPQAEMGEFQSFLPRGGKVQATAF